MRAHVKAARRFIAAGALTFVLLVAPSRADEIVRFRFEVRDSSGAIVDSVYVGDEFELLVHLRDVRAEPLGIISAYVDVDFASHLVSPVAEGIRFGDRFGTVTTASTSTVGVLDEIGSFASGILDIPPIPESIGAREELFIAARFRAEHVGSAVFTGNPADVLPLHSITVLGLNDAIAAADVFYDSVTVTIVPEPAGWIISGGGALSVALGARRKRIRPVTTNRC